MLDPQAVLPAIFLLRSAAEAGDRDDREVSRWVVHFEMYFVRDYANEQSQNAPYPAGLLVRPV